MAEATPGLRPRPKSPSVQLNGGVWRWHITMAASILHRAAGVGLYLGALIFMAWALSLASGPDAYGVFTGMAGSIAGRIVLFAISLGAFYHMANGVRHLVWDTGHGFKLTTANATAWLVIGFAILAALAYWALIMTTSGAG